MDHEAERAPVTMFSLAELLALGGGLPPSTSIHGEWRPLRRPVASARSFRAPGGWWNLTGRPQLGLMATRSPISIFMWPWCCGIAGCRPRSSLYVLAAAVQDYIDDVRPADNDDWLTLVRAAQAVPRERIDDDVAAVTAGGPLVPDPEDRRPENRGRESFANPPNRGRKSCPKIGDGVVCKAAERQDRCRKHSIHGRWTYEKGTGLPSATAGLAVAKTTPVPFPEGAQMKIRASVAAS